MKVSNGSATLQNMMRAADRLEKKVGPNERVAMDAIRNRGLKEVASAIGTGCATEVTPRALKQALKQVGAEVRKADANHDGKLSTTEQKRLSPLAARLLSVARPAAEDAGVVSGSCSSSTTPARARERPQTVSSACASPAPEPAPAPRPRPVSTSCSSVATPPSRVSTGC